MTPAWSRTHLDGFPDSHQRVDQRHALTCGSCSSAPIYHPPTRARYPPGDANFALPRRENFCNLPHLRFAAPTNRSNTMRPTRFSSRLMLCRNSPDNAFISNKLAFFMTTNTDLARTTTRWRTVASKPLTTLLYSSPRNSRGGDNAQARAHYSSRTQTDHRWPMDQLPNIPNKSGNALT